MKAYTWKVLSRDEQTEILARPKFFYSNDFKLTVEKIVAQVKSEKDAALFALSQAYDQVKLEELKVSAAEFNEASAQIAPEVFTALQYALKQIKTYHQAQKQETKVVETAPGIRCERISRPLDAVGLYIPGGSAPLVSTVLMLGVPALVAECPLRIICTPPNKEGKVNPNILVAAELCGIKQVFKVGGAQAIAAMAYGTESIPQVTKIFGPGNAWVMAAKMLVAQDAQGAAIDMPAGPSEVMVIADEGNAEFIAADLLSQAEHGPDSQVIFISSSATLIKETLAAVNAQCAQALRRDIILKALEHARCIEVENIDIAIDIANRYAPEHLILSMQEASSYVAKIRNAGAVFLGAYTPEAMGDYLTGSNHVLPTSGYARAYSGLGLVDFMKFISVQTVTSDGLKMAGPYAEVLASVEGLDAHKQAISLRLKTLFE